MSDAHIAFALICLNWIICAAWIAVGVMFRMIHRKDRRQDRR